MAQSQLEPLPVWVDNVFPQSGHCGTVGPEESIGGKRRWQWHLSCSGVQTKLDHPANIQLKKKNALGNAILELDHKQLLNLMWQAFHFVATHCTTITGYRHNLVFYSRAVCVCWVCEHSTSYELWPSENCIPSFKVKELPSVTSSMFCLSLMQQIHLIFLKNTNDEGCRARDQEALLLNACKHPD